MSSDQHVPDQTFLMDQSGPAVLTNEHDPKEGTRREGDVTLISRRDCPPK